MARPGIQDRTWSRLQSAPSACVQGHGLSAYQGLIPMGDRATIIYLFAISTFLIRKKSWSRPRCLHLPDRSLGVAPKTRPLGKRHAGDRLSNLIRPAQITSSPTAARGSGERASESLEAKPPQIVATARVPPCAHYCVHSMRTRLGAVGQHNKAGGCLAWLDGPGKLRRMENVVFGKARCRERPWRECSSSVALLFNLNQPL